MSRWITARRRALMNAARGIDVAALAISYTGTYQDYGVVQMTGGSYRLLAFTGAGMLNIDKAVRCEVCVVGGGANGYRGAGGAGGYLKNQVLADYSGGAVVVGAAQGTSSIGGVSVAAVSGQSGGTGGGGYSFTFGAGSGDGISKYPFGDTAYALLADKPHCAGGAGGGDSHPSNGNYTGGNGGTNGRSGGGANEYDGDGDPLGGTGGVYGGGNGGRGSSYYQNSGSNATYYGSGGGGYGNGNGVSGSTGSGYQGIVYVRIPVNQSLLAA